jgi:hypothetical protein
VSRIIHQTWKSRVLPTQFEAFVRSWMTMNPAWQYVLWTDADADAFMAQYFPSFVDMYVCSFGLHRGKHTRRDSDNVCCGAGVVVMQRAYHVRLGMYLCLCLLCVVCLYLCLSA